MSSVLAGDLVALERLLAPATIRARAAAMLDLALDGGTGFRVRLEKLDAVAERVCAVTLRNYPELRIPFHSRWNHFQAGGRDRNAELDAQLAGLDPDARTRAKLDLAVVSVLLDAGAGMAWRYREADSAYVGSRSEGLAVASWHLFREGAFSSVPGEPLRADAAGLAKLELAQLAAGFQASEANPMVGLEGRFQLLKSLGRALAADPELFPGARPGGLLDHFKADGPALPAPKVLRALQRGLGSIWPGRLSLATPAGEVNLGDAWHYAPLGPLSVDAVVPFHKLSQWLSYSLLEPFMAAGLEVTDVDGLTGLAEYRNGGLMLDGGLLELRDPAEAELVHAPGSERIVEWRALTLALLDRLAGPVRARLGRTPADFPLAKILEGGTWWAGRELAAERRTDGGPPLKIQSDGTVF